MPSCVASQGLLAALLSCGDQRRVYGRGLLRAGATPYQDRCDAGSRITKHCSTCCARKQSAARPLHNPATPVHRCIPIWRSFAYRVALAKPNPAIFWRTLEALGAEPSAAVHVGDDQAVDVVGAHQAGMRVVQVGTPLAADPAEPPDRWIDTLDALPAVLESIEADETR